MSFDSNTPVLAEKWSRYRGTMNLVAPNKKDASDHHRGTGMAGASAAATLENSAAKSNVSPSTIARAARTASPPRGINAAKNCANDGDSVYRLFTIRSTGGDYRSRESNVYRLAEVSRNIIDHKCVAQGVPLPAITADCSTTAPSGRAGEPYVLCPPKVPDRAAIAAALYWASRQIAEGNVECSTATRCSTCTG